MIGATYFVTPKIGLEASVGTIGFGFTRFTGKVQFDGGGESDSRIDNKNFAFSFDPSAFNLGARFYLGK